jgi:hypothetical protein
MRKSLLRRPSPALAVAFLALLVALGGTAYAGISIPKNSVGSKQLKKGAVTNAKIKSSAVTTGKIDSGAVTASKINASGLTVPNALYANSAGSATKATTATTAADATIADSLGGVQYEVAGAVNNPPSTQSGSLVECPSGTFVVGGGGITTGGIDESISSSYPADFHSSIPNAWSLTMNNTNATTTYTYNVYAICAPLSNPVPYLARLARK